MVADYAHEPNAAAPDGHATESATPMFDYADYSSAREAYIDDSSSNSRWHRSADDYFAHFPAGASNQAASDRGAGHGSWSGSATGLGTSDRASGRGLANDDLDSQDDSVGMSDDAAETAGFGFGGASFAALAGPPPPPPAAASSNGPGTIEVGANELFIYAISVEVTSSGVQIHGEILHGGSSLSGFTVAFTGAFSGTATTASDGSFDFVYHGSDSGLVEANASGGGMTSDPYTFFV